MPHLRSNGASGKLPRPGEDPCHGELQPQETLGNEVLVFKMFFVMVGKGGG